MQFTLRSLLVVTAIVAVVLGVARLVVPAIQAAAPAELSMLWWMAGFAALSVAIGAVVVYANK